MLRQRYLVLALTALALSLYPGNRRLAYAQVPPKQLYFAYLSSFSGGFDSSGSVPAVELALRQIALNNSILPGYVLDYTRVRDTQVSGYRFGALGRYSLRFRIPRESYRGRSPLTTLVAMGYLTENLMYSICNVIPH